MPDINPVVDPASLDLDHWRQGTLYEARDSSFAKRLGLTDLGIRYVEVPPGKSACPFHNHHVEDELFIILEGEGTYRYGNERHAVKAGDILGAPAGGPETAHNLINTGTAPLRYLAVSSVGVADICQYPDSGKILVSSSPRRTMPDGFELMHRHTPGVPYWTDEPGAGEEKSDGSEG
ncbi:cupin domain-containing protein [Mangrovicella endophytica]|uniref:cupin domain-containing protein n=1 Tax=Mangrovicella endophytica TaxID=2066697 RepID=UPI000C9E1D8C|nr:cupin domain-containing protein [Mangrovicella endophytica]